MPPGIEVRHQRGCPSRDGRRCGCKPSYRAAVWSAREGREIRRTLPTLAAARSWRAEAITAVRRGTLTAERQMTVRQAAEALIDGMADGTVRNRSGDRYKPSVVRGYRAHLKRHVVPALGGMKLDAVRRADVQGLCNRLVADGASPSTVRNAIMPLRVLYRRALRVGQVAVSPLEHLELPAVRGVRDRVASPEEAAALLTALPAGDRAVWATALYAGLRLGELKALRVEDVDLDGGRISVERSWDAQDGAIEPKSRSGRRRVPIAEELRAHLAEYLLRSGRREGLIFGRSETRPFAHVSLRERALRAWSRAGLEPIGLPSAGTPSRPCASRRG